MVLPLDVKIKAFATVSICMLYEASVKICGILLVMPVDMPKHDCHGDACCHNACGTSAIRGAATTLQVDVADTDDGGTDKDAEDPTNGERSEMRWDG